MKIQADLESAESAKQRQCCARKIKWSHARALFLSALSKVGDMELRRDTLRMLVEADHQLHRGDEEECTRRELKALLKPEQKDAIAGNTVDVLDSKADK